MSKGLEALKEIKNRWAWHNPQHDLEDNFDYIEKELKEKETQDDYIKMLEDRIDNLETSYQRIKKALEIIISKGVNVGLLKRCGDIESYLWQIHTQVSQGVSHELTEEEYSLLKEVLL